MMSSSTSELGDRADVYSPTVSYGEKTASGFRLATVHMSNHSHRISSTPEILGEVEDCSNWCVKFTDYEELRSMYLRLLENGYE